MYGSYGSYSSMSATSSPMDIPVNKHLRSCDASCAFPSWPRSDTLSPNDEPRASSYLSDDDLFLSEPFDDDTHSISSASSSSSSTPVGPSPPPQTNDIAHEDFLRMEDERFTMQREFIRQIKAEKERRRQAALRARRSLTKKSSPRSNTKPAANLTTISEAGE